MQRWWTRINDSMQRCRQASPDYVKLKNRFNLAPQPAHRLRTAVATQAAGLIVSVILSSSSVVRAAGHVRVASAPSCTHPEASRRSRRCSSTHRPETRMNSCGLWSLVRAADTPRSHSCRLPKLMVNRLYRTRGSSIRYGPNTNVPLRCRLIGAPAPSASKPYPTSICASGLFERPLRNQRQNSQPVVSHHAGAQLCRFRDHLLQVSCGYASVSSNRCLSESGA